MHKLCEQVQSIVFFIISSRSVPGFYTSYFVSSSKIRHCITNHYACLTWLDSMFRSQRVNLQCLGFLFAHPTLKYFTYDFLDCGREEMYTLVELLEYVPAQPGRIQRCTYNYNCAETENFRTTEWIYWNASASLIHIYYVRRILFQRQYKGRSKAYVFSKIRKRSFHILRLIDSLSSKWPNCHHSFLRLWSQFLCSRVVCSAFLLLFSSSMKVNWLSFVTSIYSRMQIK